MNRVLFFICLCISFIISESCTTKKAVSGIYTPPVIAKPSSTELLVQKINLNENNFNYYSVKSEVEFKDLSNDQNFDISIVMEKDQYIWMSVNVLFGFEPFRMKITPDSLYILDRVHRQCVITDYNFIKKFTKANLSLHQLQQLIIGNPVFRNDEKQSIADTVLSNIIIYTILDSLKQTAFYNTSLKLVKNSIENRNSRQQLTVEYGNPVMDGTNYYPSVLNINIRAEKNMECKFKLSNFAFEKKKESSFTIPGSYEIIRP